MKIPRAFALAFLVLAAITAWNHFSYPLSYGQDFHYHLMSAAMGARSTSEPIRGLYQSINPFDANTLLYTIAYPFEKVMSPVRAFQVTCTLAYYVGYPAGCAYALLRCGRSPWGSLLSFPLAYGLVSIAGGFWPFLLGAALLAPALAEMQVLHGAVGVKARNAGVACAALSVLTFLAHAMVFAWLALLLALHTCVVMAWACGLDGLASPRDGARRMLRVGLRSLAVIAPALCLALRWLWSMTLGGNQPDHAFPYAPPMEPSMADKLLKTIDYLAPTRGHLEYWYLGCLWLVAGVALVFGGRARTRHGPQILERSFLVTFAGYVVCPFWFMYEPTSPRLFDLAVLTFPLILFPTPPRLRSRAAAAIMAVFIFSVLRVRYVGRQLQLLDEIDYAGLVHTADTCARVVSHDRVNKLAYVNGAPDLVAFKAAGAQQLHETFAAQCGLETPVYDTHVSYNSLVPLRYAGPMPAPRTMIGGSSWYAHPGLWENFEYVLVRDWPVARAEEPLVAPHARLVASYGRYQLWERKPPAP